MDDFKAVSFVVFDENGKPHRAAIDKLLDETPNVFLKGDASLLLSRWSIMSTRMEMFLKGQIK